VTASSTNSGFRIGGFDGATPIHRFAHAAMACRWEVWLADCSTEYARAAARAAFAEIDRLEGELSRFIRSSDVARVNSLGADQSVVVGAETFECLELAAWVNRETHGAFDVTVRSREAGAGRARRPSPDGESTDRPKRSRSVESLAPPVLGGGTLGRLALDHKTRRVTALAGDVQIDLGGIGKGYALDQMIRVLDDWSIGSLLVHSGQSTLFARCGAGQDSHWTVGIRNPERPSSALGFVRLRDQALSGSGQTVHGAHIVDPRTGQPPDGGIGAWARSSSAAMSDALSTAFMVMSDREVADYCRAHPDVAGLRRVAVAGRVDRPVDGPVDGRVDHRVDGQGAAAGGVAGSGSHAHAMQEGSLRLISYGQDWNLAAAPGYGEF